MQLKHLLTTIRFRHLLNYILLLLLLSLLLLLLLLLLYQLNSI